MWNLLRALRRLPLTLLVTTAMWACTESPVDNLQVVEGNVDVRDVDFAPELGVDLSQMTEHPSGLYYEDVVEGEGTEAEAFFVLRVEYQLWLSDGTLIEDTRGDDQPFAFQLGTNLVIVGWDAGLVGVKPGGKRRLIIPPQLAYGPVGTGPIPPQATLVFDIDVLEIEVI